MLQGDLPERDLTAFVLPEIGRLHETGERWTPYQLLGSSGAVVEPVQVFFAELQAEDKPASTIRSYGMDLLRWWRFLWALDIEWNRATRTDARDFTRWMQIANKPQRLHWRHRKAGYTAETAPQTVRKKIAGTPNAITGKPSPGPRYAARTRAHCETDPGPADRRRPAGRRLRLQRTRMESAHAAALPVRSQRRDLRHERRLPPQMPQRRPRRHRPDRRRRLPPGL
ncbi:hypothetical protein GCM10010256_77060 [Streptomyces coeruleorubidus]|nr:hypothetical protein GCM10010256_77060 [Streptomyces coeruleorubidus]